MDAFLTAALKFGPWVFITGFTVREMFRYLTARDASGKPAGDLSSAPKNQGSESQAERTVRVEDAILDMARNATAQTEILRAQTQLLKECVSGHGETQKTLVRVETKLDVRRPNGRN